MENVQFCDVSVMLALGGNPNAVHRKSGSADNLVAKNRGVSFDGESDSTR